MHADKGVGTRMQTLRARAEVVILQKVASGTVMTEEALRAVEELRIHQVELELQNEQLQELELRLEDERARYCELYHEAPVGYLTLDWHGTIQDANRTAARMLGKESAQLVGAPLAVCLDTAGTSVLLMHLRNTRHADTHQVCDLTLKRPDGTLLPVHVQSIATRSPETPDGVCRMILSDLAQRGPDHALGNHSSQLGALLDNAPHMLARIDRHYRYVLVNRPFAEAAGILPDQAVGRSCRELLCPLARCEAWHAALAGALETGQRQHLDLEAADHGQRRFYEVRVIPEPPANGRTETVLTLVRDVTALRGLQAELNQSQRMGIAGQLAAGIAHDVNNVLMAIAGYATLGRMRMPAGDETTGLLKQIEDAVQDAGAIANAVLAFTHKLPTEKRPVELRTAVERAARLLRRMLPASIELTTDTPGQNGGGGVWVFGDRTQLQQVVLNLAINARDAMPEGGKLRIALAASSGPRAGASGPDAQAQLQIVDTGCGIAPEVLPHVFEPQFTTKPVLAGTGLGLATIKEIVEQHGGQIAVDSHLGQGTTFTITLPRVAPPALPEQSREAQAAPRGGGELILVAEDNHQVRQVLTTSLQQLGYEVVQASDARDLAAQFAHWQARARLIVADVDLPKGSGLDALRVIRRGCPTLPAIVITAKVDFDLEAVADSHTRTLRKPFRLSEFNRAVNELLAQP